MLKFKSTINMRGVEVKMVNEEIKTEIEEIITNPQLTFHQRKHQLATYAESLLNYVPISKEAAFAKENGIICDLFEGHAPYRPRYILPDYDKAIKQGSKFLELDPPKDLDEAINFLTILYTHVPSITGYPVYLGNLDRLLESFSEKYDDDTLYKKLKLFLITIDRLLPDGFTHANIGPEGTRVGRLLFKLERELKQVVPNLTLKYDQEKTSDELLIEGVKTVFEVGKPHFANHQMITSDLGEKYGVASCYNSLKEGGGAHTLVRLNLKKAAKEHRGRPQEFLDTTLLKYVKLALEVIESRAEYLVNKAKFFEHNFLALEGIISKAKFSSMLGIFGLKECTETLLDDNAHYGHDKEANKFSYKITDKILEILDKTEISHAEGNSNKAMFHSQSGIDLDTDTTPGTRITPGEEPDLFNHIKVVAPHHSKFIAGVSDIFHFEGTIRNNPKAVCDIIKGAFKEGMREFTFNLTDGEFVRITGYLVRRSDLEKYKNDESTRYTTTPLGEGAINIQGVLKRKRRMINHERNPWFN
ncbi:YjjI family glycine radical enzyme [Natranaerobius trueperi]|uniref:YjjI family glycine radical enzyme n=1 Tax=Natranaerobius trueperi TaxID=759412 RepID=A0A226C0K0_9FIRM|nr:YjjI family glycine radical enzyme [Natranaerobius trueperi]OWZ84783.1 YjjI family glycine radical enzyme [Natranaerobius trueperi]